MKKKVMIEDTTYMVWFGVERGTDLTDLIEYVKQQIKEGKTSGFYPHFEAKKLIKK